MTRRRRKRKVIGSSISFSFNLILLISRFLVILIFLRFCCCCCSCSERCWHNYHHSVRNSSCSQGKIKAFEWYQFFHSKVLVGLLWSFSCRKTGFYTRTTHQYLLICICMCACLDCRCNWNFQTKLKNSDANQYSIDENYEGHIDWQNTRCEEAVGSKCWNMPPHKLFSLSRGINKLAFNFTHTHVGCVLVEYYLY